MIRRRWCVFFIFVLFVLLRINGGCFTVVHENFAIVLWKLGTQSMSTGPFEAMRVRLDP